jgi:Fic family protein
MTARLSANEVDQARHRRMGAMRLQEIEGNPLSAADVAMFEMFEREAWPHDRRLAYILAAVAPLAAE